MLQTGEQKFSPGRIKSHEAKDSQCFRRPEDVSEFSLSSLFLTDSNVSVCLDFKISMWITGHACACGVFWRS